MSEALYLKEAYLKEWEATVASADGKFIVLDRTAFYPNSGGQPWDTGIIVHGGEEYHVDYVGKFSGNISHELAPVPAFIPGDIVQCSLDWNRRYMLMRSHTAAHIISQVIFRSTGAMITGNQLGTDRCRIDFSVKEFDRDSLSSFQDEANEVVAQALDVRYEFYEGDDIRRLLSEPGMTKLARGFKEDISPLRLVRIGDFDVQADGGTHVANTREVGRIMFTDFSNKGKNNRRIYFQLD